MKILHITDFHFREDQNSKIEQKRLVEELIKTIKNDGIEFVFFTGDLVNNGKNPAAFFEAGELLLTNLIGKLNIPKSNVFFCGGNHDVFRNQELIAIQTELDKIDSVNKLEDFIVSQNGKQFEASLVNHQNFISYHKSFFSEETNETNEVCELFSIHKRIVNDNVVGIATINTAWRSLKSETDRGNLLYPPSFINMIIDKLKDCTIKILLLHHPLSDLKYWNQAELEDLIHNNFLMMFSGHVHKMKSGNFITKDEGIYFSVAPATLSLYDSESTVGISIIDVDLNTFEVVSELRLYDKSSNSFFHQENKHFSEIPLQGEKKIQNDFRKKLRKIYEIEIERANDLFISISDADTGKPFLDLFTSPILKTKSKAQISKSIEIIPTVKLANLRDELGNFVVYGKDKTGKSSLLYKILLDLLTKSPSDKIVPFYIDARKYNESINTLDFITILARYFELSKKKTEELLERFNFKFLIDNFNPENIEFTRKFLDFISRFPKINYIITTEETIRATYDDLGLDNQSFSTLYIHEITQKEVRSLANKWPNIPEDKREHILTKISQIFQQLNMPMNYWTVSLFLWIFEKTNEANFHNNFELIQLYIDNLLDRKRLALDKSLKIDFEDFKTYLSELAHDLITNHNKTIYSAKYSEIVTFTEKYRNQNKRFVIPVEDIVQLIIHKGILKKTVEDRYTFRLNGVFEYFIAFYMKDNSSFRDSIIKDAHYYLSFNNEFELYSGFKKKNKEFVEEIYNRTVSIFEPVKEMYNNGRTKDQILLEKITEVFDISLPINKLTNQKSVALSPEKQDELIDEFTPIQDYQTEVKEKKFYDEIELKSENLEKALFILCRVFRNSSVNDDLFNNNVFNFILDSACELGFLFIDESQSPADYMSETSEIENEKILMKLATNFMPLLVQTFLFDAIAQNNLERIFLEKIEELKQNPEQNQFKLLIVYFLLIDLDVKGNKKYIDYVMEDISIGILKQTILVKLYFYITFKSHNLPEFEKFLRERIQKQSLKINEKEDLGSIHQRIEASKNQGFKNRSGL